MILIEMELEKHILVYNAKSNKKRAFLYASVKS